MTQITRYGQVNTQGIITVTPLSAGPFVLFEAYESLRLKFESERLLCEIVKKELQDERAMANVLREEIAVWRNRALRAEQVGVAALQAGLGESNG